MNPHAFSSSNHFCMHAERGAVCNLHEGAGIHKLFEVTRPEREQFWPGSALSVWQGHADAVLALLKKKQVYGNAWQEQGYMGNLARILSKTSRLKNMLWQDVRENMLDPASPHNSDESVIDTLYDLSALCALAIANIEEGNRWGHG